MSDVREILTDRLKVLGFDGLCNRDGLCACRLDDLAPCESNMADCKPGHAVEFSDGCDGTCGLGDECDWHIVIGARPVQETAGIDQ